MPDDSCSRWFAGNKNHKAIRVSLRIAFLGYKSKKSILKGNCGNSNLQRRFRDAK